MQHDNSMLYSYSHGMCSQVCVCVCVFCSVEEYFATKPALRHSILPLYKYCMDACKGLWAMHEKGLCHGDFKPQNCLYKWDEASVSAASLQPMCAADECKQLHDLFVCVQQLMASIANSVLACVSAGL